MFPAGLPQVVAIVGPTASAKTPLSLIIAERLQSEIVSADSRQVYRHLDIGTAKPPPEQLAKIPHHFVDILDPKDLYSAGEFAKAARNVCRTLARERKVPVVVGGSGLYVKALIDGMFDGPGRVEEIRRRLEMRWEEEGAMVLFEELRRLDPEAARRMDVSKKRRIIRALEVHAATGMPISAHHQSGRTEPEFAFVQFALNWPRSILYERINRRVDSMMQSGLLEEVKNLLAMGYDGRLNALNTVGYKEILEFVGGKIPTLEKAAELIKRNTRRFAKRQLTWFRADKRIRWIEVGDDPSLERIADEVISTLRRVD